MPNVMVALLNIGVALCSTPQSLADAETRNALKFEWVPQTRQQMSAAGYVAFGTSLCRYRYIARERHFLR